MFDIWPILDYQLLLNLIQMVYRFTITCDYFDIIYVKNKKKFMDLVLYFSILFTNKLKTYLISFIN